MGTRIFAKLSSGAELIGDERAIPVKWNVRHEVRDWCVENSINAKYSGTGSSLAFDVDLWRVKDERQRMLFLLKWGNENCS